MDRQIIYPGAIALDTDQLLQSRNTMVGLGYLAKMMLGDATPCADGLQCTPATGLAVMLSAGSLTLPTVIDASYVGLLPPDGDPLLKIGINTAPVLVQLGSPGAFLISATVTEVAGGDLPIAYYDAANPSLALIGPGGDGLPQASVLQQRIGFAATAAGLAPAGSTPLWSVEIPAGAIAVGPGMITPAPGAPFIAVKLPQAAPLLSPGFSGAPTAPTALPGDVSTLLATTAFVSGANRRSRAVWIKAGTNVWTCPAGVSQILFRGWGAGGAGGTGSGGSPAGGGGGGGYLEVLLDVAQGQAYPVVVGSGATASATVTPTSFGGLLSVFGGGNGGNGGSQPGVGGTVGSDAVLQLAALSNPGISAGQAGYVAGGTAIGGAGGGSYGSTLGFANTGLGAGLPGGWPGGGGSGGAPGPGGPGADGLVILEWCGEPAA
ncbi:glycine-rich domain-containing protein [Lichenicoccus roseus]|uniref:Glycine-rich domain-containing protein n=1 Tax=Lichenicoccus roseus TaxID=2683649 RepID=A0A5R9J4X9_9PROT|nr:hypothetical protein [Lichenicoccus roseus]TLU72674.1 hypothetical protein FE263_11615 [Lichenicoccus roseus]